MKRLLAATLLFGSACSTQTPSTPPPAGADTNNVAPSHGLLAVGSPAPDFSLQDQSGTTRTLSEQRGRPVVVYFYPRDSTPGCTTEACAFRDVWDRFRAAGAVVYGISVDDVQSHLEFAQEHALNFPLLADTERRAVEAFGVPTRLGMASRVTFLVDADGRVAKVYPDVDPGVHAAEVLADIAALPGAAVAPAEASGSQAVVDGAGAGGP
ncbi:MAG: peroxiredoxin [Myxococcales bacterium]|nr:peroxiredoxin [Myxococcales bacterium]MCB9531430.1 peroxiredoxin [Myxococcales bacterium]MCB9534059.1 peroxiredoxin [Myxococcales bacterium]